MDQIYSNKNKAPDVHTAPTQSLNSHALLVDSWLGRNLQVFPLSDFLT